MSFSNDIGRVVIDLSDPATGPLAPTLGGHVFHNPLSFMNRDWSIKSRADNQTTIHHLSNITKPDGSAQRVVDKSTYRVYNTNRENISPANECQINLKGPNATPNADVSYSDGTRTTMKQTTLHNHKGGVTASIPNMMVQSNYTTKDHTGGSTKVSVRTLVKDYMPGGTSVTGSKCVGGVGEINFKNIDGDKIHTSGTGTYNQAVPELSRINPRFKEQQGEINFNPNRIKKEDKLRLDPSQISGLLNNAYSIYNKSPNPDMPVFNCDSRPSNYNAFKTQAISRSPLEDKMPDAAIPVNNSKKNPNEVIVRGTHGDIENPFLFRKIEPVSHPTNKGRCYSGTLEGSGYFNDSFMRDAHRYINPHGTY